MITIPIPFAILLALYLAITFVNGLITQSRVTNLEHQLIRTRQQAGLKDHSWQ